MTTNSSRLGTIYAALAFTLWGVFPFYWKQIHHISADEILAHRITWAAFVTFGLVALYRTWPVLQHAIRTPRILGVFCLTAILISSNWLIYIWAVNNNKIVEASLGYFIQPLVTVCLGVLVLKEVLRPLQKFAIGLAALAVTVLTIDLGELPWVALGLAGTMAVYGLLRKTASLEAVEGLCLETAVLLPFSIGYICWQESTGFGALGTSSIGAVFLLLLSGPITTAPLLLYNAAARRIPFSTLGLMQYIAPSLQFLIGCLVYKEPLGISQFFAFLGIWTALAFYTYEGLSHHARQKR